MKYTLQIITACVLCFAPCVALAQDCGETVTVSSGDTLFGIAQECDTSVSALVAANDQVTNPDVIRVGWELRIPDGERVDTDPQPPRTEPERPRTEPRQRGWTGNVRVAPGSGAPGASVRVLASGFPPTTAVNIGAGPVGSEYEVVRHNVRTNANGGFIARAQLPTYADPNSQWIFVVETDDHRIRGRSEPFDVRADRGGRVGDPRDDRGDSRVIVRGQLTNEGAECPVLRAQDGTVYTLAGRTGQFTAGDYVRVEGRIAEMSTCMQGTTISVDQIMVWKEGAGIGDDDDGNLRQVLRVEGVLQEGVECPIIRSADGEVYSLTGDLEGFQARDRVYVEGTRAEASICMQGTTLSIREIRATR